MTTVTMGALLKRINRKLWHERRRLVTLRSFKLEYGDYVLLDAINQVETTHIDPVALARELGVMGEWEQVADASAKVQPRVLPHE